MGTVRVYRCNRAQFLVRQIERVQFILRVAIFLGGGWEREQLPPPHVKNEEAPDSCACGHWSASTRGIAYPTALGYRREYHSICVAVLWSGTALTLLFVPADRENLTTNDIQKIQIVVGDWGHRCVRTQPRRKRYVEVG